MKHSRKHLFVAGLLACVGFAAAAQGTPPAPPAGGPPPQGMHRPDPARMAEFHAKRMAHFKAKLKITPQQEGAWTAFTTATQPPAPPAGPRPDRHAFEKLTTPQRIERFQAMKAERDAQMARRMDATKTFYAALTPEQQKVFDKETAHGPGRHGHGAHDHGPRDGGPRDGGH